MKKTMLIYCFILLQQLAYSQVQEAVINHILENTSVKKSYAILFKNSDKKINFVWSNDLLDYYKNKVNSRAKVVKIIKPKLLSGDTFSVASNSEMSVGSIDDIKLSQINKDAAKGLNFLIKKYFSKRQLKPEYADYVKEICFCLWVKKTYLFVGLESGSLPIIGVMNNKIIVPSKVKSNIDKSISAELEFYFSKYDYYLNMKAPDTSMLYLKLNSKRTDIQRISPDVYNGTYEYARFTVDKKKRIIIVELYDSLKNIKMKEKYSYGTVIHQFQETNFYNLTTTQKTIKHQVIIPVLLTQ